MENKVVPFKTAGDLPFTMLQRLRDAGRNYGLESIYPFAAEDIIVAEWVSLKCRYGCSHYNRRLVLSSGDSRSR